MPTSPSAPPTRKRKTLERLWQLLPQLQYFTFAATPGQSSTTGWRGCGYGHIDASNDDNGWLLAEHGHFHPAGQAHPLPFRNSYRWQQLDDRLRLSHERFGADNAVFLFDLVATESTRIVCVRPHSCGCDTYHGAITLTAHGFDFDWVINGPRKHEHLHYRYRSGQ